MKADLNSDLVELQNEIKKSLRTVEDIAMSERPVKMAEKKRAFLSLKEKIGTLLTYSQYLQTYGDSCYESSVTSQKEANKLAKAKKQVQQRMQHYENEVMSLQKRVIEQQRSIQELKLMNRLDVSYISSISFNNDSQEKETEKIEEYSENSILESSDIGSYYSNSKSHLKKENEEMILQDSEIDNFQLVKEFELLVFSQDNQKN